MPASLSPLVAGYAWMRDTIGEAGAAVYRPHAPGRPDLYCKHGIGAVADVIVDEMARMRWLGRHTAVPAVRDFVLDGSGTWLLMSALLGRPAYEVLATRPATTQAVVD